MGYLLLLRILQHHGTGGAAGQQGLTVAHEHLAGFLGMLVPSSSLFL